MRFLLIFAFALLMMVNVAQAKAKTYLVETKDGADQEFPATKTIDGNMGDVLGEDYWCC